MKKAVCLLSGGPDSAVATAVAKRDGYGIYCISFDYGQIASKEIESAEAIAKKLGAKEHKILDISILNEIYGPGVTSLMDKKMKMPEKFESSVIVPFRNGILISIAAGYASAIGADAIYYGAHKDDAPFYPDCRPEFVKAISDAIFRGTESKITVKNPLAGMKKAEIMKLAAELGVPLELTWSCYLNGKLHCGRCESCRNRKNAFRAAGIKDPTKYAE
jgi:7-cyano-7-deazaguanine synthase